MSAVGDVFKEKIGQPIKSSKLGFQFSMEWDQIVLDDLFQEIGAGIFCNGFLHLLGSDVSELDQLLINWKFLFNDDISRRVIGRNAHGSLLIIENESEFGTVAPIGYLDLINCRYIKNEDLDFMGLIGNWIPNNRLGNLCDSTIYEEFLMVKGNELMNNEILAIKKPLNLDGMLTIENFQTENIFQYHESVAEIYKKQINK
jgi:hypothetical protein